MPALADDRPLLPLRWRVYRVTPTGPRFLWGVRGDRWDKAEAAVNEARRWAPSLRREVLRVEHITAGGKITTDFPAEVS